MASSSNNGSGNGVEELRSSGNVVELITNSSKKIVKEIQDQMIVVLSHLDGIGKYIELIQKSMEHLNKRIINLKFKVDNIEVKVEMTIVGMLK